MTGVEYIRTYLRARRLVSDGARERVQKWMDDYRASTMDNFHADRHAWMMSDPEWEEAVMLSVLKGRWD